MPDASVRRIGFLLLGSFLAVGCAGDERAEVAGKVTLNGVALESGRIDFLPIEGTEGPSAGAVITAGSYSIARDKGPVVGVYRVEIRSQRKTGNKIPAGSPAPPGTMVDEVVEAVPARYNTKSTLRSEIKPGSNPLDYVLTSD